LRLDDRIAGGLAALTAGCVRHAKVVLAVALLLTGVFGYGVSTITTNVDVADVLPRGDPNTEAAHDLTERFKSTFTQQVSLQLHVDETGLAWARDNARLTHRGAVPPAGGSARPPDPGNITDEVYVRATAELVEFVQERTSFDRAITVSNLYALLNWTLEGGDGSGGQPAAPESAFSVPGYRTREHAVRYHQVDMAVRATVLSAVDAIASPSWNHAVALFMPPADADRPSRELGEEMLAVRDEYVRAVAEGRTEFTVFGPNNPPLFTVDLPVANAHSSRLVREDTLRLMPVIVALIAAFLYVAFRNLRATAVSLATLGAGVVWSYGTMGFLGIPLNTLNMTIVPLVLGVGIDYTLHVVNEFAEHKSEGHSDAEAFRISAGRSGMALLVATGTTVGGLLVLVWSPSLLIADMGLVAALALTYLYVLSITVLPALLVTVGGTKAMGRRFKPSRLMPALARGVTKLRVVALVGLLAGSGVAYLAASTIQNEAFGDPGRNYLPDDPIRQEHEEGLRGFYEVEDPKEKANILTFQGPGILTPDAMRYYRLIESNLKNESLVVADTLRTVPFFIETWLTIKGGIVGAAGTVGAREILGIPLPVPLPGDPGQRIDPFPDTEEAIKAEVEGMFASPMKEFASIILNHPANDMAAMTFSVRAGTFAEAEQAWHQVWSAVAKANATFGGQAPDGIERVAFVGNTATNYLFIAKELPWLQYMNLTANAVLVALAFLLTRSIRITLVTLAISFVTQLWWTGILPSLGIGLAITLTLPMAFIIAIGTDYAIHLMWNIRRTGDPRAIFATTGKAVLFSTLTTICAFAVFILVQNVAVARTMVATTVAFAVIFAVTLLVVPVFFPVAGKTRPGPRPAAAAAPSVAASPPTAPRAAPAPRKPLSPGRLPRGKRVPGVKK
jgi:uncharacterized protein